MKNVDSFIVGPSTRNQHNERMRKDVLCCVILLRSVTFYYIFYAREDGELFTIDNHIDVLVLRLAFLRKQRI